MKKVLVMSVVLFFMGFSVVSAQTKEEMKASQARYEKLADLLKKEPKTTGVGEIDTYVTNVLNASKLSQSLTEQLQGLYFRSIGETKDGVTDVNVKKPTVEELTALAGTIATQAVTVKDAATSAEAALNASKEQKNPMKVAKIASALGFTKDAYPIVVEESAAQAKAIQGMIETAKTAKNL